MAIGMQKLVAESGYEYLTRQVAVVDATGRGHSTLSDYNSAQGESPGHWSGDALNGVGLAPGDEVTSEQLKLLFRAGLHAVTWRRGVDLAVGKARSCRVEDVSRQRAGNPVNLPGYR